MAVGLGTLRLPPADFWRMTPKELEAAVRGLRGHTSSLAAPTHADLQQLMQLFPDG